jgi:predicted DsbA family dithiol-disulfide isomerase
MTASSTVSGLAIDVFSDVVCPWCYIGDRRLTRALAQRSGVPVVRRWRPFQLQPHIPRHGLAWGDFVRTKFGGFDRARPLFERVTAVGESVGATFDFARIANSPNTADAHRLILFAAERGDEWPLVDRLFRAHFAEGRDIGDIETLAELAQSVGADGAEVRRYLATDRNRGAVSQSQQTAQELGIGGVPFFVFGGRYGVSGAQPEEILTRAIDLIATDTLAGDYPR